MTVSGRSIQFTALLAVCLLSGCAEPSVRDCFIRCDKAQRGVYEFELDFCDPACSYDIYLYSSAKGLSALENVKLDIRWTAPSGEVARETVYFHHVETRGTKELYRSGFRPETAGKWKLSVRPAGHEDDITGIGMICMRNGTRQT